MDRVRITDRISLDFDQRAEAYHLAMEHDLERLAEMVVFYRDLAQDLYEACEFALEAIRSASAISPRQAMAAKRLREVLSKARSEA